MCKRESRQFFCMEAQSKPQALRVYGLCLSMFGHNITHLSLEIFLNFCPLAWYHLYRIISLLIHCYLFSKNWKKFGVSWIYNIVLIPALQQSDSVIHAVVPLLSRVWPSATSWAAARQSCLSFTISWSLLRLMSMESMMPSNHFVLYWPLLPHSVFPRIRVFSNELAHCIRWPKYWSSASVSALLMNIQCWFPLRLTGLISLLSKGLSRVCTSTTVWNIFIFPFSYSFPL